MKILLVCEALSAPGGWYTYARELARSLQQRGHSVICCTHAGSGEGEAILPRPLVLLSAPWKSLHAARVLQQVLERERPDIIHITVEPYALLVPFLSSFWRKKCVLTVHGSYGIRLFEKWRSRVLASKALLQIPRIITVSAYTKEAMLTFFRQKKWMTLVKYVEHSASVIPNGISLPSWKPSNKKNAVPMILHVGGVKPRKGVLEAIDGCAEYGKQGGKRFHLHIVGECSDNESYVRRVRARIAELKLEQNVTLHGIVSDHELSQMYEGADVLLLPALTGVNTFEGFGLVYLEANARGIPVIGPSDSGASEAISEGVSGYKVDPHDASLIAERLQWIVDEKRLKAEDCRKWAEAHSIEQMSVAIEQLYKRKSKT